MTAGYCWPHGARERKHSGEGNLQPDILTSQFLGERRKHTHTQSARARTKKEKVIGRYHTRVVPAFTSPNGQRQTDKAERAQCIQDNIRPVWFLRATIF